MQITRSKTQYFPTVILIVVGILLYLLSCGGVAAAFDFHADSAHGNRSYGVNRSGVVPHPDHPEAYDIGDCAHCHDTFDPAICGANPLMLFKTQYFCVQCHQDPDSSDQTGMPVQGCYSYKFGGDTTITCPLNVMTAFLFIDQTSGSGQPRWNCSTNKGSAHHLADIRVFLENRWGFGDTSDDINLCEGCHNPHKAQRHGYAVDSKGTSPLSRPSTHNGDWDVYGAELTERMDSYASPQVYLAPYYYNGTGTGKYEPDGGDQQYGANMPDYVTVCTDCHNSTNTIWSRQLGRYLYKFNWDNEKHGRAAASDGAGYTDFQLPYYDNQSGNYVLSCTDCHEPHGSPNPFLIRQKVNDGAVSMGHWKLLCQNCHKDRGHDENEPHYKILQQQGGCGPCHLTSENPPGVYLGPCTECHYHGGSFTTNYNNTYKTF